MNQIQPQENETPRFLINLAYFLAFSSFLVGFWHAYLGLKGQMFFGSEYGAFLVAAVALAFVTATYGMLVRGKIFFIFPYLLAAIAMMIFNFNYFYPADFKEDLVREAATELKDSLNSYSVKFNLNTTSEALKDIQTIEKEADNLYLEIKYREGRGPVAKKHLADINNILAKYNSVVTLSEGMGTREQEADDFKLKIDREIRDIYLKESNAKQAAELIKLDSAFDALKESSIQTLQKIETDTTKINLKEVKKNIENNPQNISKIIDIASSANSLIKNHNELKKSENSNFKALDALSTDIKNLGEIHHTLPSMWLKLNGKNELHKIGTIKNILLVMFFDIAIPLVMFLILYNNSIKQKKKSTGPVPVPV